MGILAEAKTDLNVRKAGEDIARGTVALKKGTVIRPAEIGLMASLGYSRVKAVRRPVVAILSTGNELVELDSAEAKSAKTKDLAGAFEKLGLSNVLVIDGAQVNENFAKAASNLINVDVLPVQGINVYDILRRQKLVLTKAAVEALEARFK